MQPTNQPFRKENNLPNLHDYVPCQSSRVYFNGLNNGGIREYGVISWKQLLGYSPNSTNFFFPLITFYHGKSPFFTTIWGVPLDSHDFPQLRTAGCLGEGCLGWS